MKPVRSLLVDQYFYTQFSLMDIRRRNQVKLLLWEGDGFSLYHKRLEKGSYELPAGSDGQLAVTMEADQLLLLLKGISLHHIRRRKRYQHGVKNVDNQTC